MAEPPREPRRGLTRYMPVVVILTISVILYSIFIVYHCVPLLQLDIPPEFRDEAARSEGIAHLIVGHILTFMVFWSFYKTCATHPGGVPDIPLYRQTPIQSEFLERKRDGGLRYCLKCHLFKPDRCHHSRHTRECILKMDHFCPWVANNIGFFNYKYFYLTILYAAVDTLYAATVMFPTVSAAFADPNVPFETVYFIFLGASLSFLVFLIVGGFTVYHTYLIATNQTTIEFCEKRRGYLFRNYDIGLWKNVAQVFGDNVLLWPFPVGKPSGDGLKFETGPGYPAPDSQFEYYNPE